MSHPKNLTSLPFVAAMTAAADGALPTVPPPPPPPLPREYTGALEREVSPMFESTLRTMVDLARRIARRHGQFVDPEGLVVGGVLLGLINRYVKAHMVRGLTAAEAGDEVSVFLTGLLSTSVRLHAAQERPAAPAEGVVTP